jgi:hypothetical protein
MGSARVRMIRAQRTFEMLDGRPELDPSLIWFLLRLLDAPEREVRAA